MCHALLEDPKFFQLLKRIDHELAAQTRAGGCFYCGGVLHRANYPRKPRGCPAEVWDDCDTRFSFCCNRCRKRCTSMSVRFLGRRVYLGLAVVLVSARHAGQTPAAARMGEGLGVPIRTLERWRRWWRSDFALTPLWQAQCARFMPPVATERLPGGLLDRFAGEAHEVLMRLLYFLTPLTLPLPVLDDAAAVLIYNFLCDLVDRFDTHYGEQICHFYAVQDRANLDRHPSNDPDNIPF